MDDPEKLGPEFAPRLDFEHTKNCEMLELGLDLFGPEVVPKPSFELELQVLGVEVRLALKRSFELFSSKCSHHRPSEFEDNLGNNNPTTRDHVESMHWCLFCR